jgi:glutaredoxin
MKPKEQQIIKIEMFYDAKCKHCKFFDRYSKGKQVKHKCKLTNHSLTLKSRVCDKFEL